MPIMRNSSDTTPKQPDDMTAPAVTVPQVAVVGSGYWGRNLVRNFADLGALAMICDSRSETLRQLNEQHSSCRTSTSFDDVLQDRSIQAVAIATPAETH